MGTTPAADPAPALPAPDEQYTNTCPECDGSAIAVIYHSAIRDWETGEYPDSEEIAYPTCDGTGRLATPALPEPWAMSIRELDSWSAYYRDKLRAGLSLTPEESAHRAEVERNIALRHEARRHSYPAR